MWRYPHRSHVALDILPKWDAAAARPHLSRPLRERLEQLGELREIRREFDRRRSPDLLIHLRHRHQFGRPPNRSVQTRSTSPRFAA